MALSEHAKSASKGADTAPPAAGPAQPALSAAAAQVILKADLRNLTRKVHAGKTLSTSERRLLASVAEGSKPSAAAFVRSQVELAEAIGVDRKQIQRWRKLEGCPQPQPDGRWNVAEWRAFKAAREGEPEDPSAGNLSPSQLRARQILLQNQKLEFQIGVMRKEFVPAAEVEKWGSELGAAIRKVVGQIHLIAPTVVGLTISEAEEKLKQLEDEVLAQLHVLDDAAASYRPADEPAA